MTDDQFLQTVGEAEIGLVRDIIRQRVEAGQGILSEQIAVEAMAGLSNVDADGVVQFSHELVRLLGELVVAVVAGRIKAIREAQADAQTSVEKVVLH